MKYDPSEKEPHEGYTGFVDDKGVNWIEEARWSEDHAEFQKELRALIDVLEEIDKSCPWGHSDKAAGVAFRKIKRLARQAVKEAKPASICL
jgi:hypothetical protein